RKLPGVRGRQGGGARRGCGRLSSFLDRRRPLEVHLAASAAVPRAVCPTRRRRELESLPVDGGAERGVAEVAVDADLVRPTTPGAWRKDRGVEARRRDREGVRLLVVDDDLDAGQVLEERLEVGEVEEHVVPARDRP